MLSGSLEPPGDRSGTGSQGRKKPLKVTQVSPTLGPTVLYVIGTYPGLTTTFIDREILRLRDLGNRIFVLSLRPASAGTALSSQQKRLAEESTYLLPPKLGRVVWAILFYVVSRPHVCIPLLLWLLTRPHPCLKDRCMTLIHFFEGVYAAHVVSNRTFDHIHAHFLDRAATVALVIGRLHKCSFSLTAHASDIFKHPVLVPEKVVNAGFVVTVSEYNRRHLLSTLPEGSADRISVIHPWVDLSEFDPAAQDPEPTTFRIVSVGRLVEKKGHRYLVDWRQLEFPATTNGIPRFFRADPDHEGMVKDQQVRRLVKLKKNEKTLTMAAAKAGMSRKTARKYLKSGKLPSQCQPERYWRTRSDPFESVWPEVKEILKRSPTVEAKAVFDHLCRQQEGAFQQGQLRTLQRRIKQWKAEYGEAKEVMFPQKYQPGHQAQSDFTFMGRLGVTIQGQPFPHLLYHFVLAYSNWEATTLCFSESFESLSLGLQNALWELGALPEEHRTDRLSAAVKNLKREEFTERYQALLRHFGMRSSRTQAGKAHENGDVEQSHHRLKRAIEQELLLRCSRDFSSREEYEGFVAVIVSRRNAARQKRLGEELAVMRPLPARRLDDFTRQWVRVSPSSTIRVRHNTYSVDSRLIGERVQVRVWADQVEVYYGGRRQARMPRLRGEGKHRIDYRHVIHSLVRKPGAFTRYRWREDLFPGILFRVAYDELRRDCPATADRQYLKILEVAAQEGEQRVREALQVLIERGQRIRFEALRECLVDPVVEPWEVMVEKMDVGLYDTLLENREVRS